MTQISAALRALILQIACLFRWIVCIVRRLFGSSPPQNEIAFQMAECIYGWNAAYRIADQGGCDLRITIRIRLNPDADVTQQEIANLIATWEQGIEQRWTGVFPLSRVCGACGCQNYNVSFDAQFVDSAQHHTVRVRRGPARSNMLTWDTTDGAGTAAHEFGHMLGFIDEYPDSNCPNRTVTSDNSIMQTTAGDPRERHYVPFAGWITDFTCCSYEVA